MPIPRFVATARLAYGTARTASAVPVPAGVLAGDIVVVTVYTEDTNPVITPPTGFSAITFNPVPQTTAAGGICRLAVYWKRLTASDTGTYSFTHASAITEVSATAFRGAEPTGTPVEVLGSAINNSATATVPTVAGTTGGSNRLLMWAVAHYTAGANTQAPPGFLTLTDGDDLTTAFKEQPAPGATGNVSGSVTGTSTYAVTLIGILPNPAELPVDPLLPNRYEPIAYFDARFPGGYNASPLATGTALAQWNDLSGNGRHLLQATAARRPIYRSVHAPAGDRPAIQFDGVDDGMYIPGAQFPQVANLTLYIVVQNVQFTPYTAILGRIQQNGVHVTPFWRWTYSVSGTNFHNFRRGVDWADSASAMTAAASQVRRVVSFTTSDGRGLVDGAEVVNIIDGVITYPEGFTDVFVGANATYTERLTGSIERIAIYDGTHSAAQRTEIEQYLLNPPPMNHTRVRGGKEVFINTSIIRGGVEIPIATQVP